MNPVLCFVLQAWNPSSCQVSSMETSRFLRDYAVWEINAFLWISLITITYFLSYKLFKLFKLWNQACRIPGPSSPSFYGHFTTLSKQNLTGNKKTPFFFFYYYCFLYVNDESVSFWNLGCSWIYQISLFLTFQPYGLSIKIYINFELQMIRD